MEIVVWVNLFDFEFGIKDFNVVVCGGVKVVCLLKIDNVNDVIEMEKVIEQIECVCGCEVGSMCMLVVIESV